VRVPVRHRVDNAVWRGLAAFPLPTRRRLAYLLFMQRRLSLRAPASYSEKINWRIVYDRRPILGEMCDKLRGKELAVERAPGLRVPRVLWSGTDAGEFAATPDLPQHWVLKPNHRTAMVHIGSGRPDPQWLRQRTSGWVDDVLGQRQGEWGYSQARHVVFAEEFLGTPGRRPDDYKVLCFDGRPHVIQHDQGRSDGLHVRHFMTPDWQLLPVASGHPDPYPAARPAGLDALLDAATRLSAGLDFVRVDFYLIEGEVIFGEFTAYPGGGLEAWDPRSFDRDLGARWALPGDGQGRVG
jgi:hypothetical protein